MATPCGAAGYFTTSPQRGCCWNPDSKGRGPGTQRDAGPSEPQPVSGGSAGTRVEAGLTTRPVLLWAGAGAAGRGWDDSRHLGGQGDPPPEARSTTNHSTQIPQCASVASEHRPSRSSVSPNKTTRQLQGARGCCSPNAHLPLGVLEQTASRQSPRASEGSDASDGGMTGLGPSGTQAKRHLGRMQPVGSRWGLRCRRPPGKKGACETAASGRGPAGGSTQYLCSLGLHGAFDSGCCCND